MPFSEDRVYDVVVVGGGPGGTAAAVAAAQEGAETLLVERYGFLGGMATAGLVNPFMSYILRGKRLTSAVFNELLDRLEGRGALDSGQMIFDDEQMKLVLDRMMKEHGVDLLLHSLFTGVKLDGKTIERIYTEGKSGRLGVRGRVYVDCTGDGDLACRAGAPYELGREEDGLSQPMTLCFRLGGVRPGMDRGGLSEELNEIFLEAREAGEVEQPREDILLFRTMVPTIWHFNTTRIVGHNAVDTVEMTAAELEGRRQTEELVGLFRKRSPACRDAYLLKMAAQIGIRESRRIMGGYVLSEDDVTSGRKFDDGIARTDYNIDIHNPAGTGTFFKHVPRGDYYEIPYRSLVPPHPENLLVGSRCISSDHAAHASLRIMPVVAGIGEAAGRAAARAAGDGGRPADVDGGALKADMLPEANLDEGGGSVDREDPAGC